MLFVGVHVQRYRPSIGMTQRDLEAFRQALARVFTDFQAIDDNIDIVLFIFIKFRQRIDFVNLTINA